MRLNVGLRKRAHAGECAGGHAWCGAVPGGGLLLGGDDQVADVVGGDGDALVGAVDLGKEKECEGA